jgi:hypothetical protein
VTGRARRARRRGRRPAPRLPGRAVAWAALGVVALLPFALAQGAAPAWRALYRGTAGNEPAVLELALQDGRANGRLLLDARAQTLQGQGTVDTSGEVHLTLADQGGTTRGSLSGRRSSAPNDDGRTFDGQVTLDGTSRPLTLRRVAQFVDVDVREGPIHVSLRYPSFAGGPLAGLDPAIEPAAWASLTSFIDQGRAAQAAHQLFHGWERITTTRVEGLAGPFVSLLSETYAYTGGAHGNHTYTTRTWRMGTPTPRALQLSDLFRPNAPYLDRLVPLVLADLKAQDATWVVEGQVTTLTAADLALFSLTPAGLSFTFPPYAMGPYVQGAFTVVVPYERVLDLALPEGALHAFADAAP